MPFGTLLLITEQICQKSSETELWGKRGPYSVFSEIHGTLIYLDSGFCVLLQGIVSLFGNTGDKNTTKGD